VEAGVRGRYQRGQLVVSAEHASARVPPELANLGLAPRWLASHHGWDPGAAIVAREFARALDARLHLGRWSRLVADLNRSAWHPRVVPRTLTNGRPIPANRDLDARGRADRVDRYWRPWRQTVEAELDAAVQWYGLAFHVSIHSFVERLRGVERRSDFGLLYQPSRRLERALADRVHARLADLGYSVRRNYPYSGLADGFCMRMRSERPARRYIGFEIEMNQRTVRSTRGALEFARRLVEVLEPEFG